MVVSASWRETDLTNKQIYLRRDENMECTLGRAKGLYFSNILDITDSKLIGL